MDGPEDLSGANRCITFGVPRVGGNFGAALIVYYQIPASSRYVVLTPETIHDARIIPLDGHPHLAPHIRQWTGIREPDGRENIGRRYH